QINVLATGGSANSQNGAGGSVAVSSARNLTVDPLALDADPLGKAGNGASIALAAEGGALLVTGSLTADGANGGNGDGGAISLKSVSPTAFVVGGNNVENGVDGAVSAKGGTQGGNGGSITIVNDGPGGITMLAPNSVAIDASADGGTGGTFVARSTLGTVSVAGGTTINAAAAGTFGGGSISIEALSLTVTGSGGLVLNANGGPDNNGGSVTIKVTGTKPDIVIGDSAIDNVEPISISATGGVGSSEGGNGGTVKIIAGRHLTVDPDFLTVAPLGFAQGNGGTIELEAGNAFVLDPDNVREGNLFVSGSLSADGVGAGQGGFISLSSMTNTAFTVGAGAATNGVSGTLRANAGLLGGNGGAIIITSSGARGIPLIEPSWVP